MKSSELYRILLQDGWFKVSQKGSHAKLKHPKKTETLTFPMHGSREVAKGLEKHILKQAGIRKS